MSQIITALVGVLGVIIGVTAQYIFGRRVEQTKHYRELRTKAYIDFVKSTATISVARGSRNADREFDGSVLLADARARIAIYGSHQVVALVADFFRKYGVLSSPKAYVSFVAIVSAMRGESSGGEIGIPSEDIGQLLLSTDVNETSLLSKESDESSTG